MIFLRLTMIGMSYFYLFRFTGNTECPRIYIAIASFAQLAGFTFLIWRCGNWACCFCGAYCEMILTLV